MNKKSILIVDDEPHVLRVLKMVLEREGYQVETACDGQDALSKMALRELDLVITDFQMPRMGGKTLCENIRKMEPGVDIPILVMTSRTEAEARDWVAAMGNTRFLEKPVSPRQLVVDLAAHFNAENLREEQHG